MSRGQISRFYPEVQNLMTKFFNTGKNPTTLILQNMIYGEDYNSDSRTQRSTIYGCIIRGREQAEIRWDMYFWKDPTKLELGFSERFSKDLMQIKFYETERIDKELNSTDFGVFHSELQSGRFGEEGKEIKNVLGDYVIIAIIFSEKIKEFSELGHNFVISTSGKEAIWFIPTLWRWNIREFGLYKRTLKIIRRQFTRGLKTSVMLPSGQPIKKALAYETVVRAAIQDKTVRTCPKCGVRNLKETDDCVICKTKLE